MAEDFFNIIILLGSVQGFILSTVLFFISNRTLVNRLLAILLSLTALAEFSLFASNRQWFGIPLLQVLAQILPYYIIMPIGPLVYFYIRAYSDPTFSISRKQKLFFLPVLLDLIPRLVAISFITGVLLNLFKNNPGPVGQFIDTYNTYVDVPRWISLSIYLWLSYRYLLKQKNKNLNNSFSWLLNFVKVFSFFQLIWLIYLIPYIIPVYTNWVLNTFSWYPVYLPLAILIYYLSLKGYAMGQKEIKLEKKETKLYLALSSDDLSIIEKKLKEAMEKDHLYLHPNLNIQLLAQHICSTPKMVSAILNNHMTTGFNDFVNAYRIEAFKKMLMNPESEKFSLTGIAFDCGFNSQATFQRAFKQMNGMSPTEYKKAVETVQ